jgi:hypothetical protein
MIAVCHAKHIQRRNGCAITNYVPVLATSSCDKTDMVDMLTCAAVDRE